MRLQHTHKIEAKRIVRMLYRMYASNETGKTGEYAIGQFHALVSRLEKALHERATRERDLAILELVQLLQN